MYDVCIIGGGQSGLVTCKTMAESGKSVIVLEKCNGCIGMFSTIKEKDLFKWSTSRYMSGFSDFPMPKTVPTWFTIRDYLNYLESYVKHFGLDKYIKYNSKVNKCYQNQNGEWIVEYNNSEKLVCKKLIVCAGLNQTPKFPEIVKGFTGEIIHTEQVYRNMNKEEWRNKFQGKRILLLGGAESAYDIGHVLVQYSNQVYYSTKNYTEWFAKGEEDPELIDRARKLENNCLYNFLDSPSFKHPTDVHLNFIEYSLPEPISNMWHEYGRLLLRLRYCKKCSNQHDELCNINETPDNLFKKYVVKRTDFMLDIHEKKANIVFYPDKIEGKTVYTKEKTIENVDIIVCATGFKKHFTFLEDDVWKGEHIKKMVPTKYSNIAFIGYARPTMGSIAAVAEMQSWWIEKYFFDETFSYKNRKPTFRTIDPLNLKNDHINTIVIGCYYLKDLAKDLKIEPNMWYLLFTDFELFLRIFTASCHPMIYRIHGYKNNDNSRKILMDTLIEINKLSYRYLLFFVVLHLLFIAFLLLVAFLLSYIVYVSQSFKKMVKYKQTIFISLAVLLIFIFYTFF